MAGDGLHFTKGQLAQLLGVTTPTISAAIDDNAPGVERTGSRGRGAKIDGRVFIPWYIERERGKARSETSSKKNRDEAERDIDLELKRTKLQQAQNALLPRPVMSATVRDVATRLDIVLKQIPDREADNFIQLESRTAAFAALQLVIDQARAVLRKSDTWLPPETSVLELSA